MKVIYEKVVEIEKDSIKEEIIQRGGSEEQQSELTRIIDLFFDSKWQECFVSLANFIRKNDNSEKVVPSEMAKMILHLSRGGLVAELAPNIELIALMDLASLGEANKTASEYALETLDTCAIKVYKHHVKAHFDKDPSLYERSNGPGEGGTVFTNYDEMVEHCKAIGGEWCYCESYVKEIDVKFISGTQGEMLVSYPSLYGFKPLPL
jgi:hypothetical protein